MHENLQKIIQMLRKFKYENLKHRIFARKLPKKKKNRNAEKIENPTSKYKSLYYRIPS